MDFKIPHRNASIANGETLSGRVALWNGESVFGIWFPADWKPASLSFQVSFDGEAFFERHFFAGREDEFIVQPSTYVEFDAKSFRGIDAIKIRSGSAESPVEQQSGVTLKVIVGH